MWPALRSCAATNPIKVAPAFAKVSAGHADPIASGTDKKRLAMCLWLRLPPLGWRKALAAQPGGVVMQTNEAIFFDLLKDMRTGWTFFRFTGTSSMRCG